jgi:hypothetical protein
VGASGLLTIVSITAACCLIPSLNAGRKCSDLIFSNGGTPNGVSYNSSRGFVWENKTVCENINAHNMNKSFFMILGKFVY